MEKMDKTTERLQAVWTIPIRALPEVDCRGLD